MADDDGASCLLPGVSGGSWYTANRDRALAQAAKNRGRRRKTTKKQENFLVVPWIFHKGRISKNALKISLAPAKILRLSIFSASTPEKLTNNFEKTIGNKKTEIERP